jgi:lipopolysaccharide biosynthesis protein
MSFTDAFRSWRRNAKALMPYVRRREYQILLRRHSDLVDGLGWDALPATAARIHAIKPVSQTLAGEVCLFVSHAPRPQLKPHVVAHIEQLLRVGVNVVLILNTDLAADAFVLDAGLQARLAGVFVRENTGFDFAAWAHVYALCEGRERWTRLFLVNDSIVGPLSATDFDRLIERIRHSTSDVVGLTENRAPVRHVQSFFLVFNATALQHPVVQRIFLRMLSLQTKDQVIDVYELRLTRVLTQHGLRCEALFPPLSNDPHSSNDTSFRWKRLIHDGFPYIKTSILDKHASDAQITALVPAEWRAADR